MIIKEHSILNPPSDKRISEFELFHKIKLPESYVDFIKKFNGAIPNELIIKCDGQDRLVEKFLCLLEDPTSEPIQGQYDISVVIAQIEDRLTDDEDQIGSKIIPFAVVFGGDFLCMDFRNSKDNPSVILWDHVESDELSPVTYIAADSIDDFLKKIVVV